jgi:uncharacterized linocin/CFP29 family protein
LEANQNELNRRIAKTADAPSNRDLDELRRQIAVLENRILLFGQQITSMKGAIDRHATDLIQMNSEIKTRPLADSAVR